MTTMETLFKNSSKMLFGWFHVIGICHKDNLKSDFLKKYKKPTTWKNFKQNKHRKRYFTPDFLNQIVNLLHSLNYTLSQLGKAIYFLEDCPLLISIPESDWFILLAPKILSD